MYVVTCCKALGYDINKLKQCLLTSSSLKVEKVERIKSSMADQKQQQKTEKKPDLGLLEEDDEFEEFPAEGS